MMIFFYTNDGRKLKHIINGLLKSWAATKVRRINYVQSYTFDEDKIKKNQEKMVQIEYIPENEQKLITLLKKAGILTYHIINN